jgi:predicted nuclease of predicted toxin-antitoxin system
VKLLFDQNLSFELLDLLASIYPGCAHVRQFGLERASDDDVWHLALEKGFTIVSKDSDFHQRSFLFGFPPKVVWLRLGNCSTSNVENVLRLHRSVIDAFCQDNEHAFLILP